MLAVKKELEELGLVKSIYEGMDEFLNQLAGMRLERWEDLQRENYRRLKESLSKAKG